MRSIGSFGNVIIALAAFLPNPTRTPGATLPVTKDQVCRPGYATSVRSVSAVTKAAVFKRYGVHPTRGEYEIDHLISLELGGSNDLTNLWPQSYRTTPWNAHLKDALEDRLHALVCAPHPTLTLQEAQTIIRTDWIKGYRLYVGEPTIR